MTIMINQEADELLYRAAFAVETVCYKLELPDGEIKDLGSKYKKKEIIEYCTSHGWVEGENYKIIRYREVEPKEHAFYLIKKWVNEIAARGDQLNLWLSPADSSNFRFAKATIPGPTGQGYKAGRPPRPHLYQEVRDYLINVHKARPIPGYEADDALGMYQDKDSIASHIDKDINMIPGMHYNWVQKKLYLVTDEGKLYREGKKVKGDGFKFFCFQLLTGDRTDNIPAVVNHKDKNKRNYGPISAMKALEKLNTKEELLDKIKDIYYSVYKEDWQKELYERADLLWICRKDGEIGSDILREYYNA
jgi:hypothetical protein